MRVPLSIICLCITFVAGNGLYAQATSQASGDDEPQYVSGMWQGLRTKLHGRSYRGNCGHGSTATSAASLG